MKIAVLKNKLYIPVKYVDKNLLKKVEDKFTSVIECYVDPSMCKFCYEKYESEVPCINDPKDCPVKYKKLFMYDVVKLQCGNFIALWRGNIPLLIKMFSNFKVRDDRSKPKMHSNLQFKGTLRKYQYKAIKNWMASNYGGMIVAPARSGKTVIGVHITCKLGLKTLVLAHQKDLIDQFYDSFEKFTNCSNLKKSVVVAKDGNIIDLAEQGYDVILSTYQTFLSKYGKERLQKVYNSFGFIVVDECHLTGADGFSKIASTFNPHLFLGLTATDKRKDERDILARFALGEVVSEVKPPQMKGKAELIYTHINIDKYERWVTMINRLAKNKKRNKLIVQYVLKDLKENYNILLVTDRVGQVKTLAKMLNEQGVKCISLHGSVPDRKTLLDKLRKDKVQVTIATRKLVQYGINVPPWSCYYCLSPTTNKPNFYQEMSRIRTPYKNKNSILIRIFIDDIKPHARYAFERTCTTVLTEQKFEFERVGILDSIYKEVNKRKPVIKEPTAWHMFNKKF